MSRYGYFPASMSVHAGFCLPLSGGKVFFSPEEVKDLLFFYDYVPLYACLTADDLDLFACYEKVKPPSPACVLESLSGRENNRYSILAFHALKVLVSPLHDESINKIKEFLHRVKAYRLNLPFFYGGLIGFFNYEAGLVFEGLAVPEPDARSCYFFLPRKVVVYDRQEKKLYGFVWLTKEENNLPAVKTAYDELDLLLQKARESLREEERLDYAGEKDDLFLASFEENVDKEAFCRMVNRAKEYIGKGDIFQVVLSRRLWKKSSADEKKVYRCLRRINPSPYMFFLSLPHEVLMGASPEMMVKVDKRVIKTRPIAGTCRIKEKGPRKEEGEKLLRDEKERAEHLMLVDLGRNDIGKVSRVGTVEVEEFFKLERYSHVMHIVSTVKGILEEGKDALDAFASCFPAGTLTGAPKRRAMEIIAELEKEPRGFYGGAVGYINFDGYLDSCITIRAVWKKDGVYYLQSGAGIVADSVPEKEFAETVNKAKALVLAIKQAEEERIDDPYYR
ncbi:anthranilate synthase component 1 [Thermosyntropha lipolytica DSM 11003]|uniref:Anthranilate synthase component 1 n=2 Tax=Thermosyntropha TaxID=54293 RepID=A0A1M5M514_9FIRM|nr:anthranilate synthase component 1 [Thermosyntropha lipolytica DSM 11003]